MFIGCFGVFLQTEQKLAEKTMKRVCLFFAQLLAVSTLMAQPLAGKEYKWAWTGWERPTGVNPIIAPKGESEFWCPMQGKTMKWEESDTFNPAATVMGGKVVVLYRAEDNSATGIGSRTSRIGYASSFDGLHFERHGSPVLYPDGGRSTAHPSLKPTMGSSPMSFPSRQVSSRR